MQLKNKAHFKWGILWGKSLFELELFLLFSILGVNYISSTARMLLLG
jgi:hypothetical protein